ncbi:unnamed protein product [Owenia fusiformis]|uniref:Uncharacterized protein n=1 Tax=Owenia fusiformis TaxID=6347 RepID=A0A8J1TWS6_OWEFU|nr:unnamed protein product [Owenia fusiformis]
MCGINCVSATVILLNLIMVSTGERLVITGVISVRMFDIIELYTDAEIPDIDRYTIEITNQGLTSRTNNMSFPVGASISAGSFIYVSSYRDRLDDFFGCYTVHFYRDRKVKLQGDNEAVILLKDGTVHDQFGDIVPEESINNSWSYNMGWAHRKDNTGPDAGFSEDNWVINKEVFTTNDNTDNANNKVYPLASFENGNITVSCPPLTTASTTLFPTTAKATTTEETITTEEPTTTEQATTTEQSATTEEPTTTEQATTTEQPTTTSQATTTEQSATTEQPTTNAQATTTEQSATTEQPTATPKRTSTTEQSTTLTLEQITSDQTTTSRPKQTTTKEQTTISESMTTREQISPSFPLSIITSISTFSTHQTSERPFKRTQLDDFLERTTPIIMLTPPPRVTKKPVYAPLKKIVYEAEDKPVVSKAIGTIWVVIMISCVGLVILLDAPALIRHIHMGYLNVKSCMPCTHGVTKRSRNGNRRPSEAAFVKKGNIVNIGDDDSFITVISNDAGSVDLINEPPKSQTYDRDDAKYDTAKSRHIHDSYLTAENIDKPTHGIHIVLQREDANQTSGFDKIQNDPYTDLHAKLGHGNKVICESDTLKIPSKHRTSPVIPFPEKSIVLEHQMGLEPIEEFV